jgi:hypothetical protein
MRGNKRQRWMISFAASAFPAHGTRQTSDCLHIPFRVPAAPDARARSARGAQTVRCARPRAHRRRAPLAATAARHCSQMTRRRQTNRSRRTTRRRAIRPRARHRSLRARRSACAWRRSERHCRRRRSIWQTRASARRGCARPSLRRCRSLGGERGKRTRDAGGGVWLGRDRASRAFEPPLAKERCARRRTLCARLRIPPHGRIISSHSSHIRTKIRAVSTRGAHCDGGRSRPPGVHLP